MKKKRKKTLAFRLLNYVCAATLAFSAAPGHTPAADEQERKAPQI